VLKRIVVTATLLFAGSLSAQQPLVSAFAGSEPLGEFSTEFERLGIAQKEGTEIKTVHVEGQLTSYVYKKPEAKSNLEVFRSYQNELKAAGFDTLLAYSKQDGDVTRLIRDLYGRMGNNLPGRRYLKGGESAAGTSLDRIKTFADFYLAAKKQQADGTYYVAIILERDRSLYAIDILKTAAMETGTVTLSLELLRSGIQNEGKYVIYDIHFDTGKATIRSESRSVMEVLASYLKSNAGANFYVVGHTDDTGAMDANMTLSEQRAAAVIAALGGQFGINVSRVTAKGVGPVAPVATNQTEAGRQLNRRVELVLRLAN
jgi:outer membrane protein OmpA-like peptidoglycan-associated protein